MAGNLTNFIIKQTIIVTASSKYIYLATMSSPDNSSARLALSSDKCSPTQATTNEWQLVGRQRKPSSTSSSSQSSASEPDLQRLTSKKIRSPTKAPPARPAFALSSNIDFPSLPASAHPSHSSSSASSDVGDPFTERVQSAIR